MAMGNILTDEEFKTVSKIAEDAKKRTGRHVEINMSAKEEVEEPTDGTKGEVGEPKEDVEESSDATVLETAEQGKGFALYKDYNKLDKNKFKKLTRD